MPKMYVAQDEWYPVYMLFDDPSYSTTVLDVPEELRARFERLAKEFGEANDEIDRLWKAARVASNA